MCSTNSDCPQGQRCDSGQCVPAGHPPGTPIKPKPSPDKAIKNAKKKLG